MSRIESATVARWCETLEGEATLERLVEQLQIWSPEEPFRLVKRRGDWHRPGGVVDSHYRPIAPRLRQWVTEEVGEDFELLMDRYRESSYFVTRLAGEHYYFNAVIGNGIADWMQLEVERLQEVLDRPLMDRDWLPDSLEEFLDPLDFPRLEPEPIAPARFRFRRLTVLADLQEQLTPATRRLLQEWGESSAGSLPFAHHWYLVLHEEVGLEGESRLSATPQPAVNPRLSLPSDPPLQGGELANALQSYNRLCGYPLAWYFNLLALPSKLEPIVEQVLHDHQGEYRYLPLRDLAIIQRWQGRGDRS